MPQETMSRSEAAWRMPDEMWEWVQALLPEVGNTHPLGGGRKRGPERAAMDAIFFVLRTGAQWNSLNATGICSSSQAHRRFQEWEAAGVFEQLWMCGLVAYDKEKRLNWSWQSMDGAMTKAPLAGGKNRAESHGSGQVRHQAQCAHGSQRHPRGLGHRRRECERLQADA